MSNIPAIKGKALRTHNVYQRCRSTYFGYQPDSFLFNFRRLREFLSSMRHPEYSCNCQDIEGLAHLLDGAKPSFRFYESPNGHLLTRYSLIQDGEQTRVLIKRYLVLNFEDISQMKLCIDEFANWTKYDTSDGPRWFRGADYPGSDRYVNHWVLEDENYVMQELFIFKTIPVDDFSFDYRILMIAPKTPKQHE